MLADFLHTLIDFIQFLWPLKIVHQWERALLLVFGRVWKEVGPGMYPVVPWFMGFHEVTIAWDVLLTEECDITTKDNRTLTFKASALARVVDVRKAVVDTHDFETAAHELVQSVLSEKLAEVEPERFAPEKRNRLNTDLKRWVEKELEAFGMEVSWVRFTTFVINPKMIRLLGTASHFG